MSRQGRDRYTPPAGSGVSVKGGGRARMPATDTNGGLSILAFDG
jgi:hypothetical protein